VSQYCNGGGGRFSLCMLRLLSSPLPTSFGTVSSSMACECETEKRENNKISKKKKENGTCSWRELWSRQDAINRSIPLTSVAYAARRCRMRRQTYDGAASSSRQRLRSTIDSGKHESLRARAVPGRRPAAKPARVRLLTRNDGGGAHAYVYFSIFSTTTATDNGNGL